jgi:hypothetical protein
MDIEETTKRRSYRGFDLVELRQNGAIKIRWHIAQRQAGMNRDYGFTPSEDEAHRKIDALLK